MLDGKGTVIPDTHQRKSALINQGAFHDYTA